VGFPDDPLILALTHSHIVPPRPDPNSYFDLRRSRRYNASMTVYVDADACPVRDDILEICKRHAVQPVFVANTGIAAVFRDNSARMEVVDGSFDAADDWLIEHAQPGDLVLTNDLLLAQRAVKKSVQAMSFKGQWLSDDVIHDLVAHREIQAQLRQMGMPAAQPAPFGKKHRSHFRSSLHDCIERLKRRQAER
jgi:uncharacterized protein